MNYEFTEEQKMFQQTIREFGKKKITPIVQEMEKNAKIPDDVIKGLADLGILGMTYSEKYGGANADPILAGIVGEELGRADISCAIPVFYLVPATWGYILHQYGSENAKEILKEVVRGRAFVGIASTEPDAGSDVANIRTNAKKKNGKWIVNGEKMFISGIREITEQLPSKGGFVSLIKTEMNAGAKGISLFYVPLNAKGITPTLLEDWGRKGISTGGFALENVELPEDYLIGKENRGFYLAMEGFDYARIIIAAVCCGGAQSALEFAMEYLKQRKTFSQPIGKYEGIQFKLAEGWARIEAIKSLTYKSLWMLSEHYKSNKFSRLEITKNIAMCKMLAPTTAFEVINDAIQWFGAFGYTEECPLHLALKGVRSYFWAEGSTEIMKIIVGRELLGKEFVAYR